MVVSFMSFLSLGFAKTMSQTAASLVLQGFGGASHATREFGDALISGAPLQEKACLDSITASILLSKNFLPENVSVIKIQCWSWRRW